MVRFLPFIVLLAACHPADPKPPINEQEAREHMINANRILVQQEAEAISDFIVRHGWTMEETGSGLHYEVYRQGHGLRPLPGEPLTAAYAVYRLDGTFCYEVDSAHPLTFIPGKGQQPRGLEEGLALMTAGSRARLVLPAHLAFGTAGDGNKIPGNTALYYDVLLLEPAHHAK